MRNFLEEAAFYLLLALGIGGFALFIMYSFQGAGFLGFCCLLVSILSLGVLSFIRKRICSSKDSDYRYSILALLACVVNVDWVKKDSEIIKVKSIIRRYYKSEAERKAAFEEFMSLLKSDISSDFKLNRFCTRVSHAVDYAAKSEILMELLSVAYADNDFSKYEEEQIKSIAGYLGFGESEYNGIKTIFKKKYEAGFYDASETEVPYSKFCILVLLAKVIESDGSVLACEMENTRIAIVHYFPTRNEQKQALDQLKEIINDKYDYDLDEICHEIKSSLKSKDILDLLGFLLSVAYANDKYESVERSIIEDFVKKVGISEQKYKSQLNQFFTNEQQKEKEKKANNDAHKDHQDNNSDDDKKKSSKYRSKYETLDTNVCILVLMAKIMDADSHQMKCELDEVKTVIRKYFKTEEDQKSALKQLQSILNSEGTKYKLEGICEILAYRLDYARKEQLMMELLAVVYADEKFGVAEGRKLQKIADCLNISREEYAKIKNRFKKKYQETHKKEKEDNRNQESRQKNRNDNRRNSYNSNRQNGNANSSGNISIRDAYIILGVSDSVSDMEVKKAYRAMAIKYHPDNVSSHGDEAVRQATETMKNINLAWELVKMARNLK